MGYEGGGIHPKLLMLLIRDQGVHTGVHCT